MMLNHDEWVLSMRAWIYDRLFQKLSSSWYRSVIEQLPRGAKVLDVGVGTGSSLLSQYELVKERALKWTGIDINSAYLSACQEGIERIGAGDHIEVRKQSIYDLAESEKLDAVYFSASFMLLRAVDSASFRARTAASADSWAFTLLAKACCFCLIAFSSSSMAETACCCAASRWRIASATSSAPRTVMEELSRDRLACKY